MTQPIKISHPNCSPFIGTFENSELSSSHRKLLTRKIKTTRAGDEPFNESLTIGRFETYTSDTTGDMGTQQLLTIGSFERRATGDSVVPHAYSPPCDL